MNLKQRMIQSVALAVGVIGMSAVAAVSGTSVATNGNEVSLQNAEVTTGRTAGVVLALNNLEEKSIEAYTLIGVEQIRANVVTASEAQMETDAEVNIETFFNIEEIGAVATESEVVEETEIATEAATEIEPETEVATEVVVEPALSEEEMLWQNRVMADVKKQMNVRAEASAEAELVGRFRKGDVAEIVEIGEEWTKIRSGNVEGYVKSSYCLYGLDALAYAKENVDTRATVTVNGLRVRSEASTETGSIVASVSKGATLIVKTDVEVPEGWVAVGYTGKTRYVSSEYVDVQFATSEAITIAEEKEIARKKAEEEAKRKAKQTTEITVVQRESYDATTDEILLLAALIQCEAGGESYEGKLAVGAVVMNRVRSSRYPNSISDVIYSPGQFTPAGNGKVASVLERGPKDSCIQAAQEAVNGVDNTNGAKSFRQAKTGRAGLVIGGHVFF